MRARDSGNLSDLAGSGHRQCHEPLSYRRRAVRTAARAGSTIRLHRHVVAGETGQGTLLSRRVSQPRGIDRRHFPEIPRFNVTYVEHTFYVPPLSEGIVVDGEVGIEATVTELLSNKNGKKTTEKLTTCNTTATVAQSN